MPFLLQYLVKLSLTLAVLYLFYQVLLRNLTFYRWNRFYLLCYSLLSFVIPLINIAPWIADQPIAEHVLMNRVIFMNRLPVEHAFSWWPYISALFLAGVVAMLIRLAMQFISIRSIRRSATMIKTDNVCLYDVDKPISPFSFAQSIFINTRQHNEEDLQKIIQHEFVHVKQQHTVDLLTGELLCIVNWYNPFAWLIRKAIRQNLEFIADNTVLESGIDARHYQYLLLKVTGLPQYTVSNNFNISSLKERIFMINKLKSARVHLLKFMFVLPLLAFVLVAFRGQQERKRQEAELLLLKNVSPVADTVPGKNNPPKFQQPRRTIRFLKEHQAVEDIDWQYDNKITIILKNGKSETYDLNRKEQKENFVKKYGTSLTTSTPPVPAATSVTVKNKETVMLENVKEEKAKLDYLAEKAAYDKQNSTYGKGEKAAYDEQKAIYEYEKTRYDKQKVIYEKEKATYEKKYGKLPPPPPPPPPALPPVAISADHDEVAIAPDSLKKVFYAQSSGNTSVSISGSQATPGPLYVIDGLIADQYDVNLISPNDISRIDILKDRSATIMYGDKGINGVVMITTKSNSTLAESKPKNSNESNGVTKIGSTKNFEGMIMVDGKEVTAEKLAKLDPLSWDSMELLTEGTASSMYGKKGKEGVILFTTKKNAAVK